MSKRHKQKLIRKLVMLVLVGVAWCGSNLQAFPKEPIAAIEETVTEYIPSEEAANTEESESSTPSMEYNGSASCVMNNNCPTFSEELIERAKEGNLLVLGELDHLGRCSKCYAVVGKETLAEGERGSIGHIRPSGWHTVKYPGIIDDLYLYNRCHLLMWKLTGILDDERNLITGTRYLNLGMLTYEEQVLDYIYSSNNHVLYSATPIFEGDNLLASGVLLEAYSVEDNGEGLSFCVYCYNVQPGIEINYATGESWIAQ